MRLDPPKPKAALPERIYVRLAPGTTPAFEETLVRRAMAVAGAWSFEVEPLDTMRVDKLREYTIPLMVVGTIAGFLLLMVGLGLTGVVWQSVTQRIREFGLRRAKGATIRHVRAQVLTEMMIMTSLALIVGGRAGRAAAAAAAAERDAGHSGAGVHRQHRRSRCWRSTC